MNNIESIFIASDHAGYDMKSKILKYFLKNQNLKMNDLGTDNCETKVDYPNYALKLSQKILSTKNSFGILVCGTGYGMCIAANKIKNIYAVQIDNPKISKFAISHNHINVLCLSGRYISLKKNIKIIKNVLDANYDNDPRHAKRIDLIKNIERKK